MIRYYSLRIRLRGFPPIFATIKRLSSPSPLRRRKCFDIGADLDSFKPGGGFKGSKRTDLTDPSFRRSKRCNTQRRSLRIVEIEEIYAVFFPAMHVQSENISGGNISLTEQVARSKTPLSDNPFDSPNNFGRVCIEVDETCPIADCIVGRIGNRLANNRWRLIRRCSSHLITFNRLALRQMASSPRMPIALPTRFIQRIFLPSNEGSEIVCVSS